MSRWTFAPMCWLTGHCFEPMGGGRRYCIHCGKVIR